MDDSEHCRNVTSKASLLLLEEDLSKRVISRSSSVGRSSRVYYYYRRPEGVPFKWEMRPGTPKHQCPVAESVLPIAPPPALLSRGLPKPSIAVQESKPSFFMKIKLLKHLNCRKYISGWTNKSLIGRQRNDNNNNNNHNKDDGHLIHNARDDGDAGPHGGSDRITNSDICSLSSSCSFSSSSSSLSGNKYSQSWKDQSLCHCRASCHGCTPWDFRNIGPFSR